MFNNIIYFPHSLGQQREGVDKTPEIIDKFINNNSNRMWVKTNPDNFYKNIENLYRLNRQYLSPKINIGGDHSMAIATVAESLEQDPNVKVLWFDAHPDINTYEMSNSKNYHGMPLSFLTGLDTDSNFPFLKQKLPFENLLYIGIRDIDIFEEYILNEYNIQYISCFDLNKDTATAIKAIDNFIGDSLIHISFDVDCLDPKYMSCTGTSVGEGLELKIVKFLIDSLYLNYKDCILNIDITELNLELGTKEEQFLSLANTLSIFEKFLK